MSEFSELSSYLIRLGFTVDEPQLRKFEAAMKDASGIVERHSAGMMKSMLLWQTAIVGAFTSASTGVLAMMEKVADADQDFRLFGMQMFMSTEAAKKMKMATDALGHSIGEIAWDPELHARYEDLQKFQDGLSKGMDKDFEANMIGIRNVTYEISKLQVGLTWLAGNVGSRLYKDLGGEDLVRRLEHLNNWVMQHLPEITSWIEAHLVPIMKDAEGIGHDLLEMLKLLAVTFTNLIGLLNGDTSIEGTEFDFKKLATAVHEAAHDLAVFVGWITKAEKVVLHFANGALLTLAGRFKEAGSEMHAGADDITPGSAGVLGVTALGTFLGAKGIASLLGKFANIGKAGAGGVLEGAGTELASGGGAAYATGAGLGLLGGSVAAGGLADFMTSDTNAKFALWVKDNIGKPLRELLSENAFLRALYGYADPIDVHGDDAEARAFRAQLNKGKSTGTIDAISKYIDDAANRIGVSPLLAHAVAWRESGENQHPYTNDPNHKAIGVMQLMPNTARGLGVDPNDAAQNIEGGVTLLHRLLKKYLGNKEEALAAYNWGEGHLDRAMKKYGGFDVSYLPPETRNYIRDVEAHMTQHVNVNVGGIHITKPNASPEEIATAVKDGVRAGVNGQTQLNLVNASTAFGW